MKNRRPPGSARGGNRRKARELAVQALYQSDLSGDDIRQAVDQLCEDAAGEPVDLEYFRRLAVGVHARLLELDGWIERVTQHWAPDRLSIVDRNILRLGIYELLAERSVPRKVVINECIELSKTFGGEGSGRFVNGILDQVAAQVCGEQEPKTGHPEDGDPASGASGDDRQPEGVVDSHG
ncbi:MAG: transcription antitermination factor NusB [Magnetococcales bacterium]|nr:transcription antitermination factor NusB [Magnetococcales bacterium]